MNSCGPANTNTSTSPLYTVRRNPLLHITLKFTLCSELQFPATKWKIYVGVREFTTLLLATIQPAISRIQD